MGLIMFLHIYLRYNRLLILEIIPMNIETTHNCPLCDSDKTKLFFKKIKSYYQCGQCFGIFLDKLYRLSQEEELRRYNIHQNDIYDLKYQHFVSPITSAIIHDFTISSEGLDFGAGPGPVISKVLQDNGYQVASYDPFYHNFPNLLEKKYDYIACCEVMEHFFDPNKEFRLLKSLLNPDGKLYCMTFLYHKDINFDTWNYKNDPTHAFIYQEETIHWIQENIGFSDVILVDRMIKFSL